MSRPGFVLEVDDRTPQLLTMSGAQLRLDRLGVGTHVVYAADAEESSDPVPLIDSALSAPQGTAALLDQLHPDLKLTLVVVDTERPLPQPRFDPRRTLAEQVLALAARAGVTDVEVVIANGLRKRWNSDDITRVLGDRVATSFLPDGLITSHDVTGADLVTVGEVDGVPVRLNRRVAQSDLAVVIGLRADNSDGCALSAGLTDVATINRIGGADGDPQLAVAVGRLVTSAVNTFALTAVLGHRCSTGPCASPPSGSGSGRRSTGSPSPWSGRWWQVCRVAAHRSSAARCGPTTRSSTCWAAPTRPC